MIDDDEATILDTALAAVRAGVSVIPIAQDGTKRPLLPKWKRYQAEVADEAKVRGWFPPERTGLGLVCGAVSGGLECLDFDQRDAFEDFRDLCHASGLEELLARVEAGHSETSPRGVHLFYQCETPKTTKLARRNGSVAIETKGEGGYVICAPSGPGVNAAGVYERLSGGVASLVFLNDDERERLHRIARMVGDVEADPTPKPDGWELAPAPGGSRRASRRGMGAAHVVG